MTFLPHTRPPVDIDDYLEREREARWEYQDEPERPFDEIDALYWDDGYPEDDE